MERRIVVEPVWKEEPDYERLARALLRIVAAKQRAAELNGESDGSREEAA